MKKSFFTKFAESGYEYLTRSKFADLLFPSQIKKDLKALNRSEKAYYTQKLMYAMGLLAVMFLLLIARIKNIYMQEDTTFVTRPKAGEEAENVTLQVNGKETYNMEVSPQILTKEAAEQQFQSFLVLLEKCVLGNNQDAMQITDNLFFPTKIENYPFQIDWASDKETLIDNIGNVHRENLKEDTVVTLTAICTYMQYQWEHEICVQVMKETLSAEETYKQNLEQYLTDDEKSQQGSVLWEFPKSFQGNELKYKSVERFDKILILALLVFAAGISLWLGKDRDLHNNRKKQQQNYEEEYLNLVSSLSLYISAGLNLQTAMQYCVKDYRTKKPKENILRGALLEFEKDMINGQSFKNALDRFADKADHIYYKRLSALLYQGFLNGTYELAETLRREVDKIREDKRRQCKVRGEKISTALIAPMMLQLCVVIAFIMFPAFSDMQF